MTIVAIVIGVRLASLASLRSVALLRLLLPLTPFSQSSAVFLPDKTGMLYGIIPANLTLDTKGKLVEQCN
jgi:hypothetical protein